MKYTEEEIRAACRARMFYQPAIDKMIRELKKLEDDHAHDWADDDMISVKELREAWLRANSPEEPARARLFMFLRDISKHRENFPLNAVVQDPEGNTWKLRAGKWMISGYPTTTVNYDVPRRPLKLLGTDSRKELGGAGG